MNSTPQHDVDHVLAYPEPPASPCWHRRAPKPQPLTPDQQRRNRELLLFVQHRPRSSRTTKTRAEARS